MYVLKKYFIIDFNENMECCKQVLFSRTLSSLEEEKSCKNNENMGKNWKNGYKITSQWTFDSSCNLQRKGVSRNEAFHNIVTQVRKFHRECKHGQEIGKRNKIVSQWGTLDVLATYRGDGVSRIEVFPSKMFLQNKTTRKRNVLNKMAFKLVQLKYSRQNYAHPCWSITQWNLLN